MTAKNIWIIGASSGIGRALAIELAEQGNHLILSARREEELNALNEELGGSHQVLPLDATDAEQIKTAAEQIETLDSVIFMSGTYDPTSINQINLESTRKIIDLNLLGPIYTVHHVLPIFEKQGHGQIVLCASVAGYSGLPNGQPYSATKSGLINFAESLRAEVKNPNIDIKMINPGFVRTPMTDKNEFEMPMITTPEIAASVIAKDLNTRKFEIHVPKKFTYFMKLIGILPYWLYFPVVKRLSPDR